MQQNQNYSRYISFKSIYNFRDLGGYCTQAGQTLPWRRIFRSGELRHMSQDDITRLKEEVKISTIIDLRNSQEVEEQGIGPLDKLGARYFNVPFVTDRYDRDNEDALFQGFTNMGQIYLYFTQHPEYARRIVEALQIIADPQYHPLVFHCAVGKDRTGILAAFILNILRVPDEDIVSDYTLTAPVMKELIKRWHNDPTVAAQLKALPGYFWEASAESMTLFLSTLTQEYGSARGYLEAHGAESSLFDRLDKALLG